MRVARPFCLVGISLLCSVGLSQERPAISATEWVQAPKGFQANSSELRGKVVVLEFWATWCSPCIEAIPHLNQLAKEFRDKGVLFLAITDDDEDRLRPFLVHQPMSAIIGIDPARTGWKTFAVPSIPHTVLIGKDGEIIGATLPENITSEVLREALAGGKPVLTPKQGVPSDLEWDDHLIDWKDGVAPASYAIVKPIATTTSGAWPRPSHITADGVPLQVLVELAYQTDNYHVDWQVQKDAGTLRAAFRVPEDHPERLFPYMQHTLADLFGIEARWQSEERDVYVLRLREGRAPMPESKNEQELAQMLQGKIKLRGQPVAKLCQFLAMPFDTVVLDETGMKGRYNFDISYQPGNDDVTIQALKDVGLEVTRARRNVKVLIVSSQGIAKAKP
jgi:uncharacterized protein (TIGR03435 family)